MKYADEPKKKGIINALILWKFITENLGEDVSWEVRRELLAEHVGSDNKYLATVARLESLPTSIFQRILWEYNLDFMSLESSLRRMTDEQHQSIKDNFDDLFMSKRLPRVLGKLKCWANMTSVGELLEEPLDEPNRYERKAAMAYDFAYLNIGFNAYPDGVKSDHSDFRKSGRKFVSSKNHEDDFVVNKNGRYAKLYRTARSNAAWKPGKKVVMNQRVCPGFWFTFIMHGLFWLASPIAAAILAVLFAKGYNLSTLGWGIFLYAFALIVPGWCSLVMLRFWLTSIIIPLGKNDKFEEYVAMPIGITIVVIVACMFVGVAAYGIYELFLLLTPVFTEPGVLLLFYVIGRYTIEQFKYLEVYKKLKSIREYSLDFQIVIPYFLLMILRPFIDLYAESIMAWLTEILVNRQAFAFVLGLFGLQTILVFLVMAMPEVADEERSSKYYLVMEKLLLRSTAISIPIVLVITVWQCVSYSDYSALVFVAAMAVLPILAMLIGRRLVKFDETAYNHLYKLEDADISILSVNEWFQSLDQFDRVGVAESLYRFTYSNVKHGQRKKTWQLLARKISGRVYGELLKLNGISSDIGYRALCLLVKGMNAKKAWKQAAIELHNEETRQARRQALYNRWNHYWSELMTRRFKIICDLYELATGAFKDSCPFILESGQVAISGKSRKK